MKPFIKAFNEVLHLILCKEMTVTSKKSAFFQFLGHNVPINCLKLLRVEKQMKPWSTAFL